MEYRPHWTLVQWLGARRAETIRIECKAVVLYLEKAITFDDVPPLKNGLQAICKIIRQHKKGIRIFISNVLPKPSSSPVGRPRVETNFMLLQAMRSVNRVLKKVHFLTAYEHFISSKGRIIWPTHKYFQDRMYGVQRSSASGGWSQNLLVLKPHRNTVNFRGKAWRIHRKISET